MSGTIRQLFSPRRPIDRTIEKVIDYYTQEEDRLSREVSEYEVTDNLESCFRKFLDAFGEGVRGGQVTEIGIWVSGFYGSGKSSFTKYLDLAREILELCRRKTGHENILLLIDEAGQYVAPRGELILNLDGLARNLKELGKGKVWIAATGQQTLSEIVERAAHNSAELNKLRDRFPIAIHLDASDIREITHRRLLDKSEEGHQRLTALFKEHGPSMVAHTRLTGTALFKGDPDAETFVRLYPFLPQHFDLLLELIRTLARSTGGIGLRSAIRVQPAARLENIKEVRAAVRLGRTPVAGGSEEVELRLEFVDPALWEGKRTELLVSTNAQVELKNTVMLLFRNDEAVEELLPEIVRSEKVPDYVDERAAYEDDLKKALTGLEADPDWTRLLDEDREAIAARLSCDLPQTAGDGDPVRLLQTLLVRKRTLPGLIEELRSEIKRKRPAEPEPGPGEIQEKTEPFGEEVVEPGDLLQPALIATSAELSSWLDAIRAKIEGLLSSGKRVRIKGILE